MKAIVSHEPACRAASCPPGTGSARLIQVEALRAGLRLAQPGAPRQLTGEPGGLASAQPGASSTRRPLSQIRVRLYALALALLAVLVLAIGAIAVYAQAGGGYDLTWNTVDAGGVTQAAGGGASAPLSTGYTLSGTAGQPDAAAWSGGGASAPLSTGYTLNGGFWQAALGATGGTTPGAEKVYLPIIVNP
jgi:hypothetical protein